MQGAITEAGKARLRAAQAAAAASRSSTTRHRVLDALRARQAAGGTSDWLRRVTGLSRSTIRRTLAVLIANRSVAVTMDPHDRRVPRYHLSLDLDGRP